MTPTGLKWIDRIHRLWDRSIPLLCLIALFLIGAGLPLAAQQVTSPTTLQSTLSAPDANVLDQQGRQHYEAAQYTEAISSWQRASTTFAAQGDRLKQAQTFSNLSLAHQQLGNWTAATAAIQAALALLTSSEEPQGIGSSLLAQAWDVQGRLQLSRGDAEAALITWQQSAALYQNPEDLARLTCNQLNQAQALQVLGLYTQAQQQLTAVTQRLQSQPDSTLKAIGLRSLGNVLRTTGNLTVARQVLQQSLDIATTIADSPAKGEALLSLGNTAAAQQDYAAAIAFYQQAAAHTLPTAVPAQLHQLHLFLETHQLEAAQALIPQIEAQIDRLPLSRTTVYARIHYAEGLIQLVKDGVRDGETGRGAGGIMDDASQLPANPPSATLPSVSPLSANPLFANPPSVAQLLGVALQQARSLQDARAESYALGTLGHLYEQHQQWGDAIQCTQQALKIAQTLDAEDIAYRWQWQLGRLFKQQRDLPAAIAAYDGAVKSLQAIRYDLATINPDIQFSFRDKVEPVYRQLVDLLLQPQNGAEPSQGNLR